MEKLIINNSFKNFRNYRDYRYWPVVVRVRFNALFKKWSHFGCFPIVWIYPSENRLWEYWGKRGCDDISSHFQQFTRNHIKTGGFLFINMDSSLPKKGRSEKGSFTMTTAGPRSPRECKQMSNMEWYVTKGDVTIRDNDFSRNTALQHRGDIV